VNEREKNGRKKNTMGQQKQQQKKKIRRRRIKNEEKRKTIYTIHIRRRKSGVWYIDQSVGSPEFYQAGGSSDLI
jgi:hypothetical protein